jgi:hypothetical protein
MDNNENQNMKIRNMGTTEILTKQSLLKEAMDAVDTMTFEPMASPDRGWEVHTSQHQPGGGWPNEGSPKPNKVIFLGSKKLGKNDKIFTSKCIVLATRIKVIYPYRNEQLCLDMYSRIKLDVRKKRQMNNWGSCKNRQDIGT